MTESIDPPWMAFGRAEEGIRPFGPGQSNPRIVEYHRGTNVEGYDDKVNWCSSFVHWCLGRAGVAGTGSALARSWLAWGEPLETPRPGCIAILWREDPAGWKGHVGFFVRLDGPAIVLLGGNQEGTVRELDYPAANVLGWRWPRPAPIEDRPA